MTIPLPRLTPESEFYWRAGEDGGLLMLRCAGCGRITHPPSPACRECGASVVPGPVRPSGTVYSFTVCSHPFPGCPPVPYVVAIVALDEQPDVHLTTRLTNCHPEAARIGLSVRVAFERHGNVYLPLFAPDDGPAGASGETDDSAV